MRVDIFGETYVLRAVESPAYIQRVAAYVDGKFYEVAKGDPALSSPKMAVLASLNIADELFKREEEWARAEAEVARRIEGIQAILEEGLAGGQRAEGDAAGVDAGDAGRA